ncbi:hypothetical protein K438DRAFT_285859 [Mycena galopus ATCC 62051]|nr:hypothetical protein K438DRAFT_285859 [Mycena galopus ATCC 62051]
MLESMQEQHSASFTAAATSLATYFRSSDGMDDEEDTERQAPSDDEAFFLSMEIRYRTCLRRPQFKGTTRPPQATDGSDDEELSQDQSLITPESSQCFDESYLWPILPVPSDLALEFDDLPPSSLVFPSANIEHRSVLDMGIEKEYQDPTEIWSDLDDEGDNLVLSLSSSDEASLAHEAHSQADLPSTDFAFVTPRSPSIGRTRNELDVNTDRVLNERHPFESPDTPLLALQTSPPRIQSLSPPEAREGSPSSLRTDLAEGHFPGLSSQADALGFELSFDSDMDDSGSDAHDLEEFEHVLHGTAHVPSIPMAETELEHQARDAGIATATVGARMDRIDEESIGLEVDEEWLDGLL